MLNGVLVSDHAYFGSPPWGVLAWRLPLRLSDDTPRLEGLVPEGAAKEASEVTRLGVSPGCAQ